MRKLLSAGNAEEKYKDMSKPRHYFYLVCMYIKRRVTQWKGTKAVKQDTGRETGMKHDLAKNK